MANTTKLISEWGCWLRRLVDLTRGNLVTDDTKKEMALTNFNPESLGAMPD
jgi:hypothetical protein